MNVMKAAACGVDRAVSSSDDAGPTVGRENSTERAACQRLLSCVGMEAEARNTGRGGLRYGAVQFCFMFLRRLGAVS